ncbi:MAG TPA: GNAT family N-acetyltransferase [Streptosporangiaceae bacterium]
MTEVAISRARGTDLAAILADYPRFWGAREQPRFLHHPMFITEFGDTAFVARRPDGQILAYLLGFIAPTGDAYIHLVAVRDDARGQGMARRLYATFAEAAVGRGARALKAITSPGNAESLTFHQALGFTLTPVEDYGGAGQARVVMRRKLGSSGAAAPR